VWKGGVLFRRAAGEVKLAILGWVEETGCMETRRKRMGKEREK